MCPGSLLFFAFSVLGALGSCVVCHWQVEGAALKLRCLEPLHVAVPIDADPTSVGAPTGAATDVPARFPADGGLSLEPRKVDGTQIRVTDEAFAIGAYLVSPTRGDHEVMNLLLGLVSL